MDGHEGLFFDDDEPLRPLLPPEDRLWRHPSELATLDFGGLPRRRAGAGMITLAVVAGLAAVALYASLRPVSSPSRLGTSLSSSLTSLMPLRSDPANTVPISTAAPATTVAPYETTTATTAGTVTAAVTPTVAVTEPPAWPVLASADGTTVFEVLLMDGGEIAVGTLEPLTGQWMLRMVDGSQRPVHQLGYSATLGLAVVALDTDATGEPSGDGAVVMPMTDGPLHEGDRLTNRGREGWVTRDLVGHNDGGRALEQAGVVRISEPAVGQLLWSDGKVAAVVVRVEGTDALVLPARLVSAASHAIARSREPSWLGVSARQENGHLVLTAVDEDGPGHALGLKTGDILASVAGKPVATPLDLITAVWSCAPDATVAIEVDRDGHLVTVRGRLADLTAAMVGTAASSASSGSIASAASDNSDNSDDSDDSDDS